MAANKLRARIAELEAQVTDLTAKNQELSSAKKQAEETHEKEKEQSKGTYEQNLKSVQGDLSSQIKAKENKIDELNDTIKQKQEQIDRKELKKLAVAYKEQEDIYNSDVTKWLIALIAVAVVLIISTGVSIHFSLDEVWYKKFEYYVADVILVSAVWFCGSQYNYLIKLRNDYANRKTLAQSFNNILNNLPEDEPIKGKFIEKATDVLCAPSLNPDKEPVLSKKVLKDTAEIFGAVVNK